MDRNDIFNKLKACIGEVLIIEDADIIQPDSHLIDDLGAESIDFVEIIHLMARTFDVQVERNAVYPDRDFLTDRQYVGADNHLTEEGEALLADKWPHLNSDKVKQPREFTSYLGSVSLLVDFLEHKLLNS